MTTDYRPCRPLQDVLHFSPSDLAANREGRLTTQQIALLRESGRPFKRMLVILGVFALLVGTPLILFASESPDAPLLFLLAMMVPGGLGALFAFRLAGIHASIGDGRVLVAEGLAETYSHRALRGGVAHYVRVGEQTFFITHALQAAFESGRAYRVFYTPKGRIIVSGEFAPAPSAATRATRFATPEFAEPLGFSRQDLDANRAGRLTAAQIARLRKSRNQHVILALVSLLAAFGAVQVWPLVGNGTWTTVFFAAVTLLAVATVVVCLWGALQRTRDAREGLVAVARGELRQSTQRVGGMRRQPDYRLEVGGVRLHVPLAVYGAFADGGHYALYYAPRSRVLLAAEPLDAPAALRQTAEAPALNPA